MRMSVKCFRLGPNAQIRKTKLKAKMTPKSQMYFARFDCGNSAISVLEVSGVDWFKFLGASFRNQEHASRFILWLFLLIYLTLHFNLRLNHVTSWKNPIWLNLFFWIVTNFIVIEFEKTNSSRLRCFGITKIREKVNEGDVSTGCWVPIPFPACFSKA